MLIFQGVDTNRTERTPLGAPGEVAFLAMTHHRLGNAAEARTALARLRELMQDPDHADEEENRRMLAEVEALVEGE